jgi:hypothetical protein
LRHVPYALIHTLFGMASLNLGLKLRASPSHQHGRGVKSRCIILVK